MTARDNSEERGDPGVVNPAFIAEDFDDSTEADDKDETSSKRSDGDGMSDTDSLSSNASTSSSPDISTKFNLKMSPRPLRRSHRSRSQQHSPESYRSSYQSNRSSVCSTRKGILKKTASSTTINMEMCNASQPQTPTDNSHTPRGSDAFDEKYLNADISRFSRSTADIPLHHQRSFNRVKFILDSGRPDNVTGDYDDIKIEKNDRTLGLDSRGKSMGKDNSGLSKSGRRCLLFTAGLLVLTMAVILGSLFGSRKLSSIPTKSIISPPDDKYIRNAIEGSFKITNKDYIESLRIYESQAFKNMSKELEALITKVIYPENTQHDVNSTATLRIIKILKGSLVPIFRIKWEKKDELSGEDVRKRIMKHLDKFGSIGEYRVDKTSVSVAALEDNCHKSLYNCSHSCIFSPHSLRFLCECPDTLVLTNNTICTSPQQTTRKVPFIVPPVVNDIIKDSGAQFHSVNPETVEVKSLPKQSQSVSNDNSKLVKPSSKAKAPSAFINGTSSSSGGGRSKLKSDGKEGKKKSSSDIKVKEAEDKEREEITESKKEAKKVESSKANEKELKTVKENIAKEDPKKIQEKDHSSVTILESKQDNEISKNDSKLIGKLDTTIFTPKSYKIEGKKKEKQEDDTKYPEEQLFTSPTIIETTISPEKKLPTFGLSPLQDKSTKIIETTTKKQEISHLLPQSKEHSDMESIKTDILHTTESSTSGPDIRTLESTKSSQISDNEVNSITSRGILTETTADSTIISKTGEVSTNITHNQRVKDGKDDVTIKTFTAESSTKQYDTSVNNRTETTMRESIEITNGLANFTNIPINNTSLHYNVSGSSEDNVITTKDKSNVIDSTMVDSELRNKTVLEILLPSQDNESENIPAEVFVNKTTSGTVGSSESISSDVVTVQAIPLSEIVKLSSTTSPILSVLVDSSSTKGLQSSTESTDHLRQPINIGVIADVSNILSSGNASFSHDNEPQLANSGKDSLNSSTNIKISEKGQPLDDDLVPEEKSLCTSDQFQCVTGSSRFGVCIPMSARCDSVYDCFDHSDENSDCIANKCFGNYPCWSGHCLQRKYVCDGIRHCGNGGDEEGCETWKCSRDEFKCASTKGKVCIPSSQRCDGQSDCFDNSDERNCSSECQSDHFMCPEGWCIPNIWKCDGTPDCTGGEDELDCDCDGLDQSSCVVGGCVPTFKLCDGLRQCPDGSDEYGCLRIHNKTNQLEVRSEEKRWSPVCGDNDTNEWIDLVCEQLGFGEVVSTELKMVNESVPRPRVKISPEALKDAQRRRAPLQYFLTPGECAADPLVHVSCKQPTCGKWSRTSTVSSDSEPNDPAWPSLGLLIQHESYDDQDVAFTSSCPATAITPVWVIASYSCLLSRPNGLEAGKWAFLIGESSPRVENTQTVNKGDAKQNTQLRYAKQIVVHPGAKKKNGLWVGDAALLRLRTPLELDGSSRLACLPDKPIGTHSHCKIATWTEANKGSTGGKTQSVQRLPLPNLTTKTCNISYYNGKLDDSHVCASFIQNSHSPCQGNEGSPLMCKNDDGSWQIHGLLSLTSTCAKFELPSIFTDVNSIKQWVMNTVEKKDSLLLEAGEGHAAEGKVIARAIQNARKEVIIEEPIKGEISVDVI